MKKRYMVTLTIESAESIKEDLRELGLPASAFSRLVDESLRNAAPAIHRMVEKAKKGEQLSFFDVAHHAVEVVEKVRKDEDA